MNDTEERRTYRICPLCEACCGLEVKTRGEQVIGIRGAQDDVFSAGYICPKGYALKDLHEDPDRLRQPLVKRDGMPEIARKIAEANLVAYHPAVRVHPETGERALFVSPGFTRGPRELRGFSPEQSEEILKLLWREATRTEYTVRFRWAPGSVAFWDNRATAHLAIADAGHLGHDRVLYRVTLEGDVPRGVDGRESELVSGEQFLGA